MKKFLSACAIMAVVSGAADAKSLSRILAETGLNSEDFDLMGQYAAGLYDRGTPKVGAVAQWSNNNSGAAGTVTLDAVNGNCVSIRHEATAGGKDKPVLIHTRRCKNADGIWVLQP
ncbi:hypothetical protein EBB79_15945 [Parasedimentitalea marina]|uniref:Surface antigen domain-containing protein n=1 Tax=Parasedimentitalea marina TaxID=2483033 RepID=A0A3T0N5A9_9RHOB|nr:hypothetical protein [Parasedimentitalea marina]AZV79223.1 hypothetical protein EBB79_15945 [Parasedimentitalea marina]